MAYVPATIEPQFVQMTGFHYDFSSGDIKYTLKFGATVSDLAKVKIQEAITGVDVLTPGWGDAAIGNVTGTAATGLFADPAFGTDPQILFLVSGAAGDGNPIRITLDSRSAVPPLVDIMIVRMTGDVFETEESERGDEMFWAGLFMAGRALGITKASDEGDPMFPKFRPEGTDSMGPNIRISQCDLDALEDILVTGPPTAGDSVTCGAPAPTTPPLQPIPTSVTCTLGQTIYLEGEAAELMVSSGVAGATIEVEITGASGVKANFTTVADGSGDANFSIPTGGSLGTNGDYTVKTSATAAGFTADATAKTFEVIGL